LETLLFSHLPFQAMLRLGGLPEWRESLRWKTIFCK